VNETAQVARLRRRLMWMIAIVAVCAVVAAGAVIGYLSFHIGWMGGVADHRHGRRLLRPDLAGDRLRQGSPVKLSIERELAHANRSQTKAIHAKQSRAMSRQSLIPGWFHRA
jgi:hypothetical protein